MTRKRILVTGATGFIGGHLVDRLHARGDEAIACGRDTATLASLRARGIETRSGELLDAPLQDWMEGADAVVHCAARSSPWGTTIDFMRDNVDATRRVFDAARTARVPRFVHLSSPSIYFQPRDQYQLSEDFTPPRRWITPYAQSKWLSEEVIRGQAGNGTQVAILRPRAVFGPGDRAIFPRLIARAASGKMPLVNDGRAVIDTTHVSNVVQAIEAALQAPLPNGAGTFNISNGEPLAVCDLFDTLFSELGLRVRYVSLPRPVAMAMAGMLEGAARVLPGNREPAVTRYTLGVIAYSQTLDISHARQRLGYAPTVSVREGIRDFAHHWKAHANA